MKNISNNTIVVGVVGLVVGLLIGWAVGHGMAAKNVSVVSDQSSSTNTDMAMNSDTMSDGGALATNPSASVESQSAIVVGDQGAGMVVTVGSVETDASAWIGVKENQNGVLGNILGVSRVDSGESKNIVINLLRPTQAGKTYSIVLFKDDGDKKFDQKLDVPMTSNGVVISQTFRTVAQ